MFRLTTPGRTRWALSYSAALLEGSVSNVFLVRDGVVLTPPLTRPILPGVTRATVLGIALERGIPCREADLFLEDVEAAEEAFLTASLMEVVPLRRIGEAGIPPGRLATDLLSALRQRRTR